jgi:hypothetical protein
MRAKVRLKSNLMASNAVLVAGRGSCVIILQCRTNEATAMRLSRPTRLLVVPHRLAHPVEANEPLLARAIRL